jgi:hypothetical protein
MPASGGCIRVFLPHAGLTSSVHSSRSGSRRGVALYDLGGNPCAIVTFALDGVDNL